MDFYYSQRYWLYRFRKIINGFTMGTHGCFITCQDMIYSYFLQKPFTPEKYLDFLQRKGYIYPDARVSNTGLEDASGYKLQFSYHPGVNKKTYGIRQVYFGPIGHWVLDHPTQVGMIIDPWDGKVKPYNSYKYTGQVRYFIEK